MQDVAEDIEAGGAALASSEPLDRPDKLPTWVLIDLNSRRTPLPGSGISESDMGSESESESDPKYDPLLSMFVCVSQLQNSMKDIDAAIHKAKRLPQGLAAAAGTPRPVTSKAQPRRSPRVSDYDPTVHPPMDLLGGDGLPNSIIAQEIVSDFREVQRDTLLPVALQSRKTMDVAIDRLSRPLDSEYKNADFGVIGFPFIELMDPVVLAKAGMLLPGISREYAYRRWTPSNIACNSEVSSDKQL